jgi:hypothetical protein
MPIEKFLERLGYTYENRQMFFFLRGAYPFYALSSFFLLTYFYFLTPEYYKEEWEYIYYITFILKFLVTFILAYITTNKVEKN